MSRSFAIALLLSAALGAASPAVALSLTVTPTSDHPGAKVGVSGSGFGDNEAVDIYFDTIDEMLVLTGSTGKFSKHTFNVPADALPGQHWISAIERDNGKGLQKSFTVATNWAGFGFNARGKRLNPYENVLSASNDGELDSAWNAVTGWNVPSPPAIAGGLVYLGSGDGNMYAFDETAGTTLWKSYADNGGFLGSPAVAGGVVYGASYGGYLYAFDAATGALKWSVPEGGGYNWSSPAVANGTVYVGGGDGQLYAFNATTGAKLWSTGISGTILNAAPAVGNGIVCEATEDGSLYALDAATGTVLWNARMESNSVYSASPVIANGVVYIATEFSQNHWFFAYDLVSGALLWAAPNSQSFETSEGTPAVANGLVYIGSSSGNLYAFNAMTGGIVWGATTGGQVYSSPAVANGVVYFGGGDGKLYARDASYGTLLWGTSGTSASPAVADGMVFAGAGHDLYAYALNGGNNAAYRHRHAPPPPFATLHPNLRLKPSH